MQGKLVLPGFTDCHIHFLDGSLSLIQVNLERSQDRGGIQQRVKELRGRPPRSAMDSGPGLDLPAFKPSGLPDKKYLDEVVPDRPVYLEGFDGHTWWANSKALQWRESRGTLLIPPAEPSSVTQNWRTHGRH